MEDMTFEQLVEANCFSNNAEERAKAAEMLEWRFGCEIRCGEMDRSVLFAHHARGCTIVAAKISANVVIFQNVTIGSNMRYNKTERKWENIGTPILGEGVIVSDGAKVLGAIAIGANTVIGAGAIVTRDIPANSVVYGVNKFKPKDPAYDLVFNRDMIPGEEIERVNAERVAVFNQKCL